MAEGFGKKTGSAKWQEFENEEYLKSLEPIVQQLNDDLPTARYDKKTLARILGELQQFMEDALGKQALPPRPFPKLPQKLLRDFTPDGPLYVIGAICHRIKTESNWKKVEFLNPARKRENLELLRQIRKELQRQRYMSNPVVCIHPSCGNDVNRLKEALQRLGAEVSTSLTEPRVTHMVYPFGPDGDPDDGLEYMRTLAFRTHEALVHWWYLPDSYDEYIPRHVAPDKLELDRKPLGPWKVYLRWVLDSDKFNEWMNPCDYETAEFQEEQEKKEAKKKAMAQGGSVAPGDTRSRTPPPEDEDDDADRAMEEEGEEGPEPEGTIPLKRKRVEDSVDATEAEPAGDESASKARCVEVDPAGSERIGPNVIRQRLLQPYAPAMEGNVRTENLSQGQKPLMVVPGVEKPVLPPKPLPPPPPTVKKELYTVPAHSSWFRYNKIHDIERRHVPDFFNGKSVSKTPQLYVEYRNFMINKYREDQSKRLTFTECRKYLLGDVTGIMRVWQFLDSWGLINYMARDGPKEVVELETQGAPGAAVKVVTAPEAPSSNLLFNFSMPVVEPLVAATYGANNLSLVTRRDVFGQTRCAWESSTEKTEFFCNAMPHVNCTELRYHCTKYPDIDLCPQAFAEGRFPAGCTSKDFVRIDRRAQQTDASGWSPQETLLLLEGLEVYGDNWSEVAEHVGSKSQVQCILKFLQLPIEDQFLDELEEAGKKIGQPVQKQGEQLEGEGQAEEEDLVPFADMSNPIMAQVAFLAMAVGPRVAAAAAKRALEVLSQDEPAAMRELEEAAKMQQMKTLPLPKPSSAKQGGAESQAGDHNAGGGGSTPKTEQEEGEAATGGDRVQEKAGKHDGSAAEDFEAMDTSPAAKTGRASPGTDTPKDDEAGAGTTDLEKPSDGPHSEEAPDNPGPRNVSAGGDNKDSAKEPTPATTQSPAEGTVGAPVPAETFILEEEEEEEEEAPGVALTSPLGSAKVRVAAATALAAAAVKAKLLADNEEREIQRLVVQVVDQQMKKLDIKLKALSELEQVLEQERAALANARRQADSDRVQMQTFRPPSQPPAPVQGGASAPMQGGVTGGTPYGPSSVGPSTLGGSYAASQGGGLPPSSGPPMPSHTPSGFNQSLSLPGMGQHTQTQQPQLSQLAQQAASAQQAQQAQASQQVQLSHLAQQVAQQAQQGQAAQQPHMSAFQPLSQIPQSSQPVPTSSLGGAFGPPHTRSSTPPAFGQSPLQPPSSMSNNPTVYPPSSQSNPSMPQTTPGLRQPSSMASMSVPPGQNAPPPSSLSLSSLPFAGSSGPLSSQSQGGMLGLRPSSMPPSSSYLSSSAALPSLPHRTPTPGQSTTPQPSLPPSSTHESQGGYGTMSGRAGSPRGDTPSHVTSSSHAPQSSGPTPSSAPLPGAMPTSLGFTPLSMQQAGSGHNPPGSSLPGSSLHAHNLPGSGLHGHNLSGSQIAHIGGGLPGNLPGGNMPGSLPQSSAPAGGGPSLLGGAGGPGMLGPMGVGALAQGLLGRPGTGGLGAGPTSAGLNVSPLPGPPGSAVRPLVGPAGYKPPSDFEQLLAQLRQQQQGGPQSTPPPPP